LLDLRGERGPLNEGKERGKGESKGPREKNGSEGKEGKKRPHNKFLVTPLLTCYVITFGMLTPLSGGSSN